MSHVVIVGCGVVGAAIAYELSLNPTLTITVLDQQPPAQGSTGAALGVLMGAISQKKKGRAWAMRDASLRRYASLIPELEAATGLQVPYNQDGIVLLRFEGDEDEEKWQTLATLRQSQGWQLDLWNAETLELRCPQVGTQLGDRPICGAIHSVHDRQLDPVALTHALVAAAKLNGVTFHFDVRVTTVLPVGNDGDRHHSPPSYQVECIRPLQDEEEPTTPVFSLAPADWIVLSTGLGTFPLTASIATSSLRSESNPSETTPNPTSSSPIDIRPVAGQAVRIQIPHPVDETTFSPVISGHDLHVVPLGAGDYWVGATVEFPDEATTAPGHQDVAIHEHQLEKVLQGAFDLFPALSTGTIIQQWVGYRPRPWNRPAPIIEPLDRQSHIILATGHYRNGVLLAPATAQRVRDFIVPE